MISRLTNIFCKLDTRNNQKLNYSLDINITSINITMAIQQKQTTELSQINTNS